MKINMFSKSNLDKAMQLLKMKYRILSNYSLFCFLKKNYCPVITILLCCSICTVHGQGVLNVDAFKGRAEVSIPIYSVVKGNIIIPVSLDYLAEGVKVSDKNDKYGLGWTLSAGGFISRTLKDLPDDKPEVGWLYGNTAALVESFAISNDDNSSTCSDEIADINYISANFSSKDAEPDVFQISAPGLSCKVVFDKNHMPKIIPYRDYKVAYTTDFYGINSFTITNDDGVKYLFSSPELTTRSTSGALSQPVPYYGRDYSLYRTAVKYYSKWHLSKITDISGRFIYLDYANDTIDEKISPVEVVVKYSGEVALYTVSTSVTPKLVKSINGGEHGSVAFLYESNRLQGVTIPGGRMVNFTFNSIASETNQYTSRRYLKSINESGCDAPPPYFFFYNDVDFTTQKTILPSFTSSQHDVWGYYNADTVINNYIPRPKIHVYPYNASMPNLERYRLNPIPGYTGISFILPGSDRQVNPVTVMAGSLNQIVYPTGGKTTIEYESNNYFDVNAQGTYLGGGIRVKKITDSDGLDTLKNVVKEYSYNDPATGLTSGKPISLPILAFTRNYDGAPGTQDYWDSSTVRSADDLSLVSTDIIYSYATLKQTGLGKTVFEYSTPGTAWSPATGDGTPPINYVARPSCINVGSLTNSRNTYPFAPNPGYAFEQGLQKSVTTYNENNAVVSKIEYAYQRTGAPEIINGLRLDYLNGVSTYTKYTVLTGVDNLVVSQKNTIYDLNNANKYSASTTQYTYGSPNHKKITKTAVVNSDETISNLYVRYVKDYLGAPFGDMASRALHGLEQANSNAIVETYRSITKPGGQETFISGKLAKYQVLHNPYLNSTMYLQQQSLAFINNDEITGFQPSYIASLTAFQQDPNYKEVSTFESYNKNGIANTINSRNKNIVAYHFKSFSAYPVVVIKNARHNEVVYSGFENEDTETSFSPINCQFVSDGRTGFNAVVVLPESYLQQSLKKGNAKNYVFSCWLKPSMAGALTITLTGTSGPATVTTLPYEASTMWKYYEISIPVIAMSSNFTLKVQSGVTVTMDDVIFYPDNSEVATYSYDGRGHKLSETNTNGVTTYYEYDGLGRLKFVKDQDKNIVRKESYSSYITPVVSVPAFTYNQANLYDGTSIPFTIKGSSNDCIKGISYTWNFGDGTAAVVSNSLNVSHVYTVAGDYPVTLTVSHPLYGTKSTVSTVKILHRPLTVILCASGVVALDNCHIEEPTIRGCSGFASDDRHTYFNISSISGCPTGATYTYKWEKSSNGSTWTVVGTGSGYSISINPVHNRDSYMVRCTVTSSCGRTGIGTASFYGYFSSSDCLQP